MNTILSKDFLIWYFDDVTYIVSYICTFNLDSACVWTSLHAADSLPALFFL